MAANGVEGKRYDWIERGPLFSLNGHHLAYRAQRDGKWYIVVDGLASNAYDDFPAGSRLLFSSNRSLRIIARRNDEFLRVEIDLTGS